MKMRIPAGFLMVLLLTVVLAVPALAQPADDPDYPAEVDSEVIVRDDVVVDETEVAGVTIVADDRAEVLGVSLALTGASVVGLLVFAVGLLALGGTLIRKRHKADVSV